MTRELVLSALAETDVAQAAEWYNRIRPGLGDDLVQCVENALARILEYPEAFTVILIDVRRVLVRRFPYGVFFRLRHDRIEIEAVFHLRAHPAHLRGRLETTSEQDCRPSRTPGGSCLPLLFPLNPNVLFSTPALASRERVRHQDSERLPSPAFGCIISLSHTRPVPLAGSGLPQGFPGIRQGSPHSANPPTQGLLRLPTSHQMPLNICQQRHEIQMAKLQSTCSGVFP